MSSGTWYSEWYSELYDAVTAQLEHELDALGYDGNTEGVAALERVKMEVATVNARRANAARAVTA